MSVEQLPLFDPAPASGPAPSSHYDWPTIDRCSAVAQARGQRLFIDAMGRHYTLYGPGLGAYGWEEYATLAELCAALGV